MSFAAWIVIASAISASPTTGGPQPNVPHWPVLEMEDQFAAPHKVSDLRGTVVVLVFSDRGGAESSRDLGARLHVHFHPTAQGQSPAIAARAPVAAIPNWPANLPMPDARIIPIAVIGEVPNPLKPMVRRRFRQVSPEGVIWLDFTDTMRQQFQVVADVPNVAVLDKKGQLRYTIAGNLQPQHYEQLVTVVEKLRREVPKAPIAGPASAPTPVPPASSYVPPIARQPANTRVR